jgi:hypothetical protein
MTAFFHDPRRPRNVRGQPLRAVRLALTRVACLAVGLLGCHHYQVNSFVPDKTSVCPGESTTLTWDVTGPASLEADPTLPGWHVDADVPSQGQRSFTELATTTFTLTALKQNDAKGNAKKQIVSVVSSGPKGRAGTCSGGVCSVTFSPRAGLAKVSRLSAPLVKVAGRDMPVAICVSHQGIPRTCVAADKDAAVSVPFDGPWTLEAQLAPPATPPMLELTFDFTCPAL